MQPRITRRYYLSVLYFILALCSSAIAAEKSEQTQSEKLLAQVFAGWEGEFSNFSALTEHPESMGHFAPIFMRGKQVELTQGEQGLLIEQAFLMDYIEAASTGQKSQDQQLAEVSYRRWLYRFVASKQVELAAIVYPLPAEVLPQDLTNEAVLKSLKRLPGCEFIWQYDLLKKEQPGLVGYRDPMRCYFINSEDKSRVGLASWVGFNPEDPERKISLIESIPYGLPEAAEEDLGIPMESHVVFEPIHFYDLTMAYLPEGESAEDEKAWAEIQPESFIHDQGQQINLKTAAEQRILPYQIKLERVGTERVKVSIYSLGEETPMRQLEVELTQGRGVFESLPLRVELKAIDLSAPLIQ